MNNKEIQHRKKQYSNFYCNQTGMQHPSDYDIHHIDHNHENNEIENLVAIPRYIHQRHHSIYNEINKIHVSYLKKPNPRDKSAIIYLMDVYEQISEKIDMYIRQRNVFLKRILDK